MPEGASDPRPLVLVVDDDPAVTNLLERSLETEGYRVRCASSAVGGVSLAWSEERPSVIVIDITIPDVDGFDVAARLRSHPRSADIPLIFMSTRSGLKDRRAARGAQNFLIKPFRPSQLIQMLRKLPA